MSESRIVVETSCICGRLHPVRTQNPYHIIDTENLPAEVIEAAAINRAHFDGIDYGEPYDQWPASFEEDGEPWDAEEAKEYYRDQARSALSAAFRTLGEINGV